MEQESLYIEGTVKKIVYRSPDNDYKVLDLQTSNGNITAVGEISDIQENDYITVSGIITSHFKYGNQLNIESYEKKQPDLKQLEGTIEKILYRNPDNGYTVFRLRSHENYITAVGEMNEMTEGEVISIKGDFTENPKYGRQFTIVSYEQKLPVSVVNIRKYLASGKIEGIGRNISSRIVDAFGEKTFEILENEPERLMEIPGISERNYGKICEGIRKTFALRKLTAFLGKYDVKFIYANRAYIFLGKNAIHDIKKNPYIMCEEYIGLNFNKADKIAFDNGIKPDSLYRIISGIIYVLKHETSKDGHSCLPFDIVIAKTAELLKTDDAPVIKAYTCAVKNKNFFEYSVNDIKYVYLPKHYIAEKYIAERMSLIQKSPENLNCEHLIDEEEKQSGIKYEKLQRHAIATAISEKAMILTGGPGTGKTTTLNAIISILMKKKLKVYIAAPTGRAAKRITELTGYNASTIHRMLGATGNNNSENNEFLDNDEYSEKTKGGNMEFTHNEDNPLECDAVVIDEASMIDIMLFESLLRALKPECKIIITGDNDQLPSVGVGNLLRNLIDSDAVSVVRLNEVFRQAQNSDIIMNAHKIVAGQYPDLINRTESDFFFFRRTSEEHTAALICELFTVRLPKAYNYSPIDDIQIIAPSRKGNLGTVELNKMLQQAINPPSESKTEIKSNNCIFRTGDKVMQKVNNYNIEWDSELNDDAEKVEGSGIFNGDIGKIVEIEEETVYIDFDKKIVKYTSEELSQIELAYAITVHKSQGCEFNTVIMPIQEGFDKLNYRNLLYTAVTRAKRLFILISPDKEIIYRIIDNQSSTERYTCLESMITEHRKELQANVEQ